MIFGAGSSPLCQPKSRAENGSDAVRPRQFDHRNDVAENVRQRDIAVILGNVVRTSAVHHDLRMQVDDIGPEAHEHLRSRLAADAAAHITVRRKEPGVFADPALGDRIAHENRFRRGRLFPVRLFEPAKTGPVILGMRIGADRNAGKYGNDSQ